MLLRNWTLPHSKNQPYASAASDQLAYLLDVAPRAPNGAISHRASQAQLWADFVYMAPPFIAAYGALKGGSKGQHFLQVAYDQVRLYREVLYDSSAKLWRHIALGSGTDPTHWGTGNAWAAAGALRVLATIQRSHAAKAMKSQQGNLVNWVEEILDGAWRHQVCVVVSAVLAALDKSCDTDLVRACVPVRAHEQQANGTLLNCLDNPKSFADSSSTALLAASTFRFASITGNNKHIPAATHALRLIRNSIDSQGWLHNTVNPLTFSSPCSPGKHSPEGQSFVLLLEAAVAAWKS